MQSATGGLVARLGSEGAGCRLGCVVPWRWLSASGFRQRPKIEAAPVHATAPRASPSDLCVPSRAHSLSHTPALPLALALLISFSFSSSLSLSLYRSLALSLSPPLSAPS